VTGLVEGHFDAEWLRWSLGTVVAIGSLVIGWLQYRKRDHVIPKQQIIFESRSSPHTHVATRVVKIAVATPDTSELQRKGLVVRGSWVKIASSRDTRGRADFTVSSWQDLSKNIPIRNRDTLWIRCAYLNVSERVIHEVRPRIAELPFLSGMSGRVILYRHRESERWDYSSLHYPKAKIEYDRPIVKTARCRNVFEGAMVDYLNRYEQLILDCIIEIIVTDGRWRIRPRWLWQYPIPWYSPPTARLKVGKYEFDDGGL
jgi:hypothetical protein